MANLGTERVVSRWRRLGVAVALSGVTLLTAHAAAQSGEPYQPVTDAELRDPPAEDWLMYRRTYDGWGYSPLDQITTGNVSTLRPVWSLATGLTDGHESPPIVNDGVMFITTPQNNVIAIDVRTGDIRWRYARVLPEGLRQIHPTNRGVALYGDKVYLATVDSFLVALDAETGSVAWETAVGDWQVGYYMTLAPLAVGGKVLVGVSGGELGIRGFVAALDAESGEEVWRTHTVPAPGEPGNDTWPGGTWRTGAVPVWVTGTYDPELNLTYWGTGNGGPWMGDKRPGDNLYANSVIALDADTGELKGYHQYHWNGSWDWDEVAPPLLIDIARGGRSIKSLVHPGRNGYLWLLERAADGISFIDATAYVHQNAFTAIDPETGRPTYDPEHKPRTGTRLMFCPSVWGGKNWPPAAFNPGTGLLYFSANDNLCAFMNTREVEYSPGQRLHRRLVADVRAGRGRSHRRAPGLEPRHGRGGLDPAVRVSELGSHPHHRGWARLRWGHQRPLFPGVRWRVRRDPLGGATQLWSHRRADLLYGRRRPIHRRAGRLGTRRGEDAERAGPKPGNHDTAAPGRRALGVCSAIALLSVLDRISGMAERNTADITNSEARTEPGGRVSRRGRMWKLRYAIQERMATMGETQQALAKTLGCNQGHLSSYIRGARGTSGDNAVDLLFDAAELLGLSPGQILEGDSQGATN